MGRGLTHLISTEGLISLPCYSGRWRCTGVPCSNDILDGFVCREMDRQARRGTLKCEASQRKEVQEQAEL